MRITVTPEIAHAAGWDAADRQMKAAGRTKWNRDDAAVACKTQCRLMLKYGDKYQQMAAESALQRMGDRGKQVTRKNSRAPSTGKSARR